MTAERPACGLGSLLAMSCRDRAEAFARRLQSRLQTLGLGAPGEPAPPAALDAPDAAPADGGSAAPPPRPPLRLGSSSDSDVYYDFDLASPASSASPASPAEEALELVVAQQPRGAAPAPAPAPAPVEPESGVTSSFLGTSPGSDSSDAFASPSSSPAWRPARRRAPCESCNGHAAPHAPHAPALNGAAHRVSENGWGPPVGERDCSQTLLGKDYAQTVPEDRCAHSVVENGSAPAVLENGSEHTVPKNEHAHTMLQTESSLGNGSAVSLNEDEVEWHQMNNVSSENICNNDGCIPENGDFWGQNNNEDAANDEAVNMRNVLNLESENESTRFTDLITSLEAATVNETDDSCDHVITENDATETESGLYSDSMFNESASLYVPHEEEIELLPSETITNESSFSTRERDELDSGFRFNDDWEDRFSDYSPEDACAETDEQANVTSKEEEREEERKVSDAGTNLSTSQNDSTYQSTFCTVANLTLECSPEGLKPARLSEEKMPSVLEDLGVLPRRPSWDEIQKEEDSLEEDVQVPEVSSSAGAEAEAGPEAGAAPAHSACCCSPSPQVICDLSPGDEDEESEEESSREEDAHKLRPEPRRRRRPPAEDGDGDGDGDGESPRQRLRRCSSLKTGKTPPGTPHRKKIVRFADALGLDLADVRTFLDDVPRVPSSAYDDLPGADLPPPSPAVDPAFAAVAGPDPAAALSLSLSAPCKALVPTFQQPGGRPDFLERIRTRFVCLENAVVADAATASVAGVVRVRNLDFHKSVYVRYSIDGWKSYADLQATYVPSSCDGFSDKFSFVLFAHTLAVGQRLEFAVRFQCKGAQHWDSNGGSNYGFQCLPAASPAPYMPLPSPEDRWGSFY